MNRFFSRLKIAILVVATTIFSHHQLQALIVNINLYQLENNFLVLLSDLHSEGTKLSNTQQMNNFLKNINTLSSTKSNHIHIIAESIFFNEIDLNQKRPIITQQFCHKFKETPNIADQLAPNLTTNNAIDLCKMDPIPAQTPTWIVWDLITTFITLKESDQKNISLIGLDPRSPIYLFGTLLSECMNTHKDTNNSTTSLGDIYNQTNDLLNIFRDTKKQNLKLITKHAGNNMIKLCEKHLNALSDMWGSQKNMNEIFPANLARTLLIQAEKGPLEQIENPTINPNVDINTPKTLKLFGITKTNTKYSINPQKLAEKSFLGYYLMEIALINKIFEYIKPQSDKITSQIIIVLSGRKHINALNLFFSQTLFKPIRTIPGPSTEQWMFVEDYITIFDLALELLMPSK